MKRKIENSKKIILGIDPGTRITGYGVIYSDLSKVLDYGCIRPPIKEKLSDRYFIIFHNVDLLIEKFQPEVVVVETQFVHKNVQSALKLGMARGVILAAAKKHGLPILEYSPTRVKSSVCHGRASKFQVQSMVRHLLQLPQIPEPEDAADALAIALCHAHTLRMNRKSQEI